jgi:hypothetical protein
MDLERVRLKRPHGRGREGGEQGFVLYARPVRRPRAAEAEDSTCGPTTPALSVALFAEPVLTPGPGRAHYPNVLPRITLSVILWASDRIVRGQGNRGCL